MHRNTAFFDKKLQLQVCFWDSHQANCNTFRRDFGLVLSASRQNSWASYSTEAFGNSTT